MAKKSNKVTRPKGDCTTHRTRSAISPRGAYLYTADEKGNSRQSPSRIKLLREITKAERLPTAEQRIAGIAAAISRHGDGQDREAFLLGLLLIDKLHRISAQESPEWLLRHLAGEVRR